MHQPLDFIPVLKYLIEYVHEYGSDPFRLLVTLMGSIYESEVHELYTQVQPQVEQTVPPLFQQGIGSSSMIQISFTELHLTASNCISICCFLGHTNVDDLMPVLSGCNINDAAFRMLMHQFIIKEQLQYNLPAYINLDINPITHNGFEILGKALATRGFMLRSMAA